nr:PREDICTED: ADP-ribosylation factor-like protein 5C [Paralichthys olivaceus]
MGFLLTKMLAVFGDKEHKVIIVGLDNAGKTTILYQFLTKEAVHTSPTIGSNVEEIVVRKTHFLVWDIGGQESLRASWHSYYCNTEQFLVVSFSSPKYHSSINIYALKGSSTVNPSILVLQGLQRAAVLILANKQDMKGSMTAKEISQCLTLDSITTHSWHVQACCALTGEGLPASLDWMRSRVVAN